MLISSTKSGFLFLSISKNSLVNHETRVIVLTPTASHPPRPRSLHLRLEYHQDHRKSDRTILIRRGLH